MSWELILLVGALTYGSRVAALTLLPSLPPAVAQMLERVPPPLFAGLAASTLVAADGSLADVPVLAATVGGLLVAPLRSLPACLIAGVSAYVLAKIVS